MNQKIIGLFFLSVASVVATPEKQAQENLLSEYCTKRIVKFTVEIKEKIASQESFGVGRLKLSGEKKKDVKELAKKKLDELKKILKEFNFHDGDYHYEIQEGDPYDNPYGNNLSSSKKHNNTQLFISVKTQKTEELKKVGDAFSQKLNTDDFYWHITPHFSVDKKIRFKLMEKAFQEVSDMGGKIETLMLAKVKKIHHAVLEQIKIFKDFKSNESFATLTLHVDLEFDD